MPDPRGCPAAARVDKGRVVPRGHHSAPRVPRGYIGEQREEGVAAQGVKAERARGAWDKLQEKDQGSGGQEGGQKERD